MDFIVITLLGYDTYGTVLELRVDSLRRSLHFMICKALTIVISIFMHDIGNFIV